LHPVITDVDKNNSQPVQKCNLRQSCISVYRLSLWYVHTVVVAVESRSNTTRTTVTNEANKFTDEDTLL